MGYVFKVYTPAYFVRKPSFGWRQAQFAKGAPLRQIDRPGRLRIGQNDKRAGEDEDILSST